MLQIDKIRLDPAMSLGAARRLQRARPGDGAARIGGVLLLAASLGLALK